MANAILERTTVKVDVSTSPLSLNATGEVLKFDGFLKVYLESKDDDDDEEMKSILPPLKVGQALQFIEMSATERYNRPPSRFTEAGLVKQLEELGIGRPSTYAPTINTVQKRGYVEKNEVEGQNRDFDMITLKNQKISDETKTEITGKEKGKLSPSNIGILVNDFLMANFESIMDFQFTATVEKQFDEIAEGGKDWHKMLGGFYKPFHATVEDTKENSDLVRGQRLLGVHPENGKNVYAKMGKFGAHVQVGDIEDEEKPKYAKLRAGQLIESVSLEEAMELFRLPRELGEFEEAPVVANLGRFGPYIGHNKAFYSIPKGEDPYEITLERALEIINTKRTDAANANIQEFEFEGKKVQVLKGRFGPYVAYDKINATIPKAKDPATITLEECMELIEAKKLAPPKAKKGRFAKK
ncbi:MAG: DNA topoisomerase, partial [Bacteroidetes bacterium]|nr:DNA topoisomerase [Bacteroidota bacterium]